MKRLSVPLVLALAVLVLGGCSQAAPAPAPTQAPAAQPKPAAPTQAPAAQPTAAPAKPTAAVAQPTAAPKVDFPAKGRSINLIVPWPAGGPVDTNVRLVAAQMEKELGIPVQIANKGGASSQVGLTDGMSAKPDGYTLIQFQMPTSPITYIDTATKAAYTRKSFLPVGQYLNDGLAVGVKTGGKYKTLKDLVDAAKAKPESVKAGTPGLTSVGTFVALLLEDAAGVKFAKVHFEGGAPGITATIGEHVDAMFTGASALAANTELTTLALFQDEPNPLQPGVPTATQLGYKVVLGTSSGMVVPAGTPKEVIAVLSNAMKKATENADVKKRFETLGVVPKYLDPAQYDAAWTYQEDIAKRLLPLVKK